LDSVLIKFYFFVLALVRQVLLADGAGVLVLEPVEDALRVVGVLALELDGLLRHLHVVLAHRADFPLLLDLLPQQSLEVLLGQSLGDLADLVAEFQQLLRGMVGTS
jgi:hypothetical protein